MPKGKYFTIITCSKCGQGEGTLKKDGKGGYVHVKCPPRKIGARTRPVTKEELGNLRKGGSEVH